MRNDISPSLWGPKYWAMLHAAADAAPPESEMTPEEQEAYDKLLDALPYILPCTKCRENLKAKYDAGLRPDTSGRESLREGFYKLHNAVNEALGKEQLGTVDMCAQSYTQQPPPTESRMFMVMTVVLLIIIAFLAILLTTTMLNK